MTFEIPHLFMLNEVGVRVYRGTNGPAKQFAPLYQASQEATKYITVNAFAVWMRRHVEEIMCDGKVI